MVATSGAQCAVCGAATRHCCSACLSMFYCSEEHQLTHWNDGHHKECAAMRTQKQQDASRSLSTAGEHGGKARSPVGGAGAGKGEGKLGKKHTVAGAHEGGVLDRLVPAGTPIVPPPTAAQTSDELAVRDGVRWQALESLRTGDWKAAVKTGLESYIMTWRYHGEDHPDLITECLLLAKAYSMLHRDAENTGATLRYLRHARALAGQQPYPHPVSNAQLYCILGELYTLQHDYGEAEKMYQVHTTLTEDHFGKHHLAASDCYTTLAAFYTKCGKFGVALEYSGKALLIRIELLGLDHARTADAHYNAGVLYRLTGDTAEAAKELGYALQARSKLFGADSVEAAEVHFSLGLVEHQRGNFAAALAYYESALKTRLARLGVEHALTVDVCFSLSTLYYDTGVLDKALTEAQTCVYLRERTLGMEHPSTADAFAHLAAVVEKLGRAAEARGFFSQAHETYARTLGHEHHKAVFCRSAVLRLEAA